MAHAFRIDTLAFARKLKEAGADERLAGAIVEGITTADTSELATKADIAGVRQEISEVRHELKEDIAGVRHELKEDIAGVRQDIAEIRVQMARQTVHVIIGLGLVFGLIQTVVTLVGSGS